MSGRHPLKPNKKFAVKNTEKLFDSFLTNKTSHKGCVCMMGAAKSINQTVSINNSG